MKRAVRQFNLPAKRLKRSKYFIVPNDRLLWILAGLFIVLLVFNLLVIPAICSPRTPKINHREAVRISGIVRNTLELYEIDENRLVTVDTLTEVTVPQDFPFYRFYKELRKQLAEAHAEIIDCKKSRSTQLLLTVGKGNVAIEHFIFKFRQVARRTSRAAIIIDDFGYSFNQMVRDFLGLEYDLTISVIPGLAYTQKIADAADVHKKEVIVHMPMEPLNESYQDRGYTLLSGQDAGVISVRLRKAFTEIPIAVGMNNHQGSKVTADAVMMKNVMLVLAKLDKFFIDSRTNTNSIACQAARKAGVKTAENNMFIDVTDNSDAIQKQLLHMAEKAQESGRIIVIGHAHKNTLKALERTLPKIRSMGVEIVPVSHLAD